MEKNWLMSSLKALNSIVGLGGIAIIIYGILMIRVWQPENKESPFSAHFPIPWFFHAFLVVGITLCAITVVGYVAARTANVCCLSCYISVLLSLLILETVIMVDLLLNPNWRKELPRNLSERVDEFDDFVESSDDIWNWFAWLIFLVQGVCVLLATLLRTRVTNDYEDVRGESEIEELSGPSLALLGPQAL